MFHHNVRWRKILALGVLAGCASWYLLSSAGLRAARAASRSYRAVQTQIAEVKKDVDALEHEYTLFTKERTFFAEKYAREHLAMSRPGDLILLTDE